MCSPTIRLPYRTWRVFVLRLQRSEIDAIANRIKRMLIQEEEMLESVLLTLCENATDAQS